MTKETTNTAVNAGQARYKASFEATAKERAELSPEQLLAINLDVQSAVNSVLAVVPQLEMLRESAAGLPAFEVVKFNAIKTYAESMQYAQRLFLSASNPVDVLPELGARATALREQLLADATALAHRKLIDGKRLAELKGGPGYLNIASDLGVLSTMLRASWSKVQERTMVQMSELDEADLIVERITEAHAARSRTATGAAAANDDRQRAFTLLIKAYDQARRAAQYLRWNEGDYEKYAPSLYAGRRGPAKPAEDPVAPEGGEVSPSAPVEGGEQPVVPVVEPIGPGGSPFI